VSLSQPVQADASATPSVSNVIPVVLFAYARPDRLAQTLATLQKNNIPLLYAYSDGPANAAVDDRVSQVRQILRAIDWCDTVIVERENNLGLGRSILTGASEVFARHDAAIVFEDDLPCVPGTYDYLAAALRHYANMPEVMSVTGWTLPQIRPANVLNEPYFDGRAESWTWGTWARVWRGMDKTALQLRTQCEQRGIDVFRYGTDLHQMAEYELAGNLWAVRFLYLHLLHGGLCLRPPHSWSSTWASTRMPRIPLVRRGGSTASCCPRQPFPACGPSRARIRRVHNFGGVCAASGPRRRCLLVTNYSNASCASSGAQWESQVDGPNA
jgi:hypothetical protein